MVIIAALDLSVLRTIHLFESATKKTKKEFRLCDRRRSEVFLHHERDGPAQSRVARRVCGNYARGRVSEGAAFDDFIDDRADPAPGAGYLSDHHDDVRGESRN